MRILFSILISLSVLTGSVGINLLNSACTCCGGEQVCQCSSSCSTEHSDAPSQVASCCSVEKPEASAEKSSCEAMGGCCTTEFFKLDVPLILVYDTHKIEVPEIELPVGFNLFFCESIMQRAYEILEGIPDKPPPIIRSGLDLSCTFLC